MEVTNTKWANRMLALAQQIATWSKDDSTKVGAVITTADGRPISWGFNGMAMGVNDDVPERHERPLKYKWMCHAERNAIDLANGPLNGAVMFVTFAPCTSCAQAIIQNRISVVAVDANYSPANVPDRWKEDMGIAAEMLEEAGVKLIEISSSVNDSI